MGGGEVEFLLTPARAERPGPKNYRCKIEGRQMRLAVVSDPCELTITMLDGSVWLPVGERPEIPPRRIVRTAGSARPLPAAAPATGSWPSFRGPQASGISEGQHLPSSWSAPRRAAT